MSLLVALSRLIDRVSEYTGIVASWLVLAAVVISAGNALSRKLLNVSSNAWLEAQWYLFGAVFLLAAAYTLARREHVRVDIIYGMFSRRKQHWIDFLGHAFFLMPFVILMLFLLIPYVINSFVSGERSPDAGGLIIWPGKSLLLLGFLLLTLQGVAEIIKKVAVLCGVMDDPWPEHGTIAPLENIASPPETDK